MKAIERTQPIKQVVTRKNNCGSFHVEEMRLARLFSRIYTDGEKIYLQIGKYCYPVGSQGCESHIKAQIENEQKRINK